MFPTPRLAYAFVSRLRMDPLRSFLMAVPHLAEGFAQSRAIATTAALAFTAETTTSAHLVHMLLLAHMMRIGMKSGALLQLRRFEVRLPSEFPSTANSTWSAR